MPFLFDRSTRRGRTLLLLCGFASGMVLTYFLSVHFAVGELATVQNRLKGAEKELKVLARKLRDSQAREQVAQQHVAVTQRANRLLQEEETTRQEELQRLQNELDFYRRLAGTSGSQPGLAVYHLELKPTASTRVHRFVLTLTQNLQRSAITTGTVQIALEGTLGDRQQTLSWAEITDGDVPVPSFRFKYFQQIEGYLAIPESFHPGQLVVTLHAKGLKKPVSRGFSWDRLASREASESVSESGSGRTGH